MEHCPLSHSSTASSTCDNDNIQDICRICHCEGEPDSPLICPCYCSGSLRYVHHYCLQQWINSSGTQSCELCKFHFIMHTKVKPLNKWEKLDMSPVEKREVLCFIACLVFAATCVVYSLYKLTTEDMASDVLGWWTKLFFDVTGIIAAFILMYIKGKVFGRLFRKWRASNCIICVQNVPETGNTVQQQVVELSNAAQVSAKILTSEEVNQLLSEKDEFHNCQSNSNDPNINHNCSSKSINVTVIKNTSREIPSPEIVSKTTQTSVTVDSPVTVDD